MRPTFISTFFPKFLLSVLSLSMSMSVLSQENVNWYTFWGLSLYSEDVDTLVGDGIGYRLGVGFQFNDIVGLEFAFDGTATLDPSSLRSAIEEEENVTLLDYSIETQRNFTLQSWRL